MGKTGRNFENEISKELLKINKKERGFFIKSPTPMKMIKNSEGAFIPIYANKALCDFIGIYNSTFVLIEVKHISTKRFEFDRLKEHQEKQLSSIKRHGGCSFILFSIQELNKLILLEIDDYLVYKSQTDKKSIKIDALVEIGREFEIKELEELFNLLIN